MTKEAKRLMSETAEQIELTDDPQEIQAAHDEAYREAMEDQGEGAEGADDAAGGADDYGRAEADDSEISKVRKEAANYRRRLRETEAERDQLAARLGDAQRAEVERQISGEQGLHSAADFWTAGVRLEDLRDDEGGIDPDKVKAERNRVLKEHPHWRHQRAPNFDAGARPLPPQSPPSFGEALKKAAG